MDDGQKKGPVARAKLEELFKKKKIGPTTLIWTSGMQEWQPVSEVDGVKELLNLTPPAPPAPPTLTEREILVNLPVAGATRRFFARHVDMMLIGFTVGPVLTYLMAYNSPEFARWLATPGSEALYMIALVPVVLFFEWLMYALFGNTLGKKLFRLAIISREGTKITRSQYSDRLTGLWFTGLALGVPLVNLIAAFWQFLKLKHSGSTSYDAGLYVVKARKLSILNWLIVVLVVGTLYFVGGAIIVFSKVIANINDTRVSWHNPDTGVSVRLPAGWTARREADGNGKYMYSFTMGQNGTEVMAIPQPLKNPLLEEHAKLWFPTVEGLSVKGPGMTRTYRNTNVLSYRGSYGAYEIDVMFVKQGAVVWNVVTFFDGSKASQQAQVEALYKALFKTLR